VARGKRFSRAELEAARRVRLADVIADDLVVLFCGANLGLSSIYCSSGSAGGPDLLGRGRSVISLAN
jgi:hypothetical protein